MTIFDKFQVCEKLKKKDKQVCELRYDKQIDLKNVNLKKLKVRDLKKILNDWDETVRDGIKSRFTWTCYACKLLTNMAIVPECTG